MLSSLFFQPILALENRFDRSARLVAFIALAIGLLLIAAVVIGLIQD